MADLEPEHLRKVFIGGLHPDTDDESLRSYFCKYGEILDCIVMKDSQTKRSRGFGFVAFDRSTCVDDLQNDRPHSLDGKKVDTKRVVPKETSAAQGRNEREQKVNKVFLGGLRDQITEEDIRQYFSQFGIVDRVETFTDKETNKRKGFCFITFQDFDSVDKCVLQAQTSPEGKLNLQGFKVEVKKAKSQDEMRRGGGGGGGGRGGGRGGFNNRGFGDYNQGGGGGYNNQSNYTGGYNQGGGSGGGGGYSNQGGFNQGGGGGGFGGGDNYSGSYNNGGGSNWGGNQQQQGGWGGNSGGSGGFNNGSNMGGGGGGGYGGNSGGYGGGNSGGFSSNSSGGGPMRGGYNKSNRTGPYGNSGGGGGGWRN